MHIVLFIARVGLGLLMLIEAYYKFIDMSGFVSQVQSFGFLPNWMAIPYAYALGPVEVVTGILLLLGWKYRVGAVLAACITFSVLFGFQVLNISTGLYSSLLVALRGILQDQHLWMVLASCVIALEGPGAWAIQKKQRSVFLRY